MNLFFLLKQMRGLLLTLMNRNALVNGPDQLFSVFSLFHAPEMLERLSPMTKVLSSQGSVIT